MSNFIKEHELIAVEAVVSAHPEGIAINGIHDKLGAQMTIRLLRYRLKRLVLDGRLAKVGSGRWTKYRSPGGGRGRGKAQKETMPGEDAAVPLSREASETRDLVRKPIHARKRVGYRRSFLESYVPNSTSYLTEEERAGLREAGVLPSGDLPAGEMGKQALLELLVDLSWNSSRLEGSTYSLQEARRLIDFGPVTEERNLTHAHMILNHEEAVGFLVNPADPIGFDRQTIMNLHSNLANFLLRPRAMGRLRWRRVDIGNSAYVPHADPRLIEECFDLILAKAGEIQDPYEQSLFVMVQLPYLQPFDDVNKRTSRLAANIPLIRADLTPITFTEVPAKAYAEAILGVYELNRTDLLKDVFIWACERSAARHKTARDENCEQDQFCLKHRFTLREVIQHIVFKHLDRESAARFIADWAGKHVEAGEQERFREMALDKIHALQEGNCSVYWIDRHLFDSWQEVWNRPKNH